MATENSTADVRMAFRSLSTDARMTYLLLWTLADDAGSVRGDPREIAKALYPGVDDAHTHIDAWLSEIEAVRLVRKSEQALEITGWHQQFLSVP
jgi:hypothetical protein